jgi:exodeoxyribonuclease V alpha subunit
MYRGAAGIDALNEALRARVNPDGKPIAGTSFRVGDKVVETVNNHELMLMNGQTGVIVSADPKRERVTLATDDERMVNVPTGETGSWRLGYCLSIHKAQGGQWPAVVLALATEHRIMLTRELVYTGLTRGASVVVGVWNPGALSLALQRRAGHRHTRLAELVVS